MGVRGLLLRLFTVSHLLENHFSKLKLLLLNSQPPSLICLILPSILILVFFLKFKIYNKKTLLGAELYEYGFLMIFENNFFKIFLQFLIYVKFFV